MTDTKNIFISYSGPFGNEFGIELHSFFNTVGLGNGKFKDNLSIKLGNNWFNEISLALDNTTHFITLIDYSYAQSQFSWYELGYFNSRIKANADKNLKVIPVNFSSLIPESIQGTQDHPIFRLQGMIPYAEDKLENLLNDICNAIQSDFEKVEFHTEKLKGHVTKFKKILEKYRFQDIRNEDVISYSSMEAESTLNNLIFTLKNKIERTFYYGFREMKKNKDVDLYNVYISYPIKLIAKLCESFDNGNKGKIEVDNVTFFADLWQYDILKSFKRSVWTTNTPGSNAREDNPVFLRGQKEIIDRISPSEEPIITRIFIYNPNDKDDLRIVGIVAKQQFNIGIKIGFIETNTFKKVTDAESIIKIGSRNYMILDDELVYVTRKNKKNNSKRQLQINSQNIITLARQERFKIDCSTKFFLKSPTTTMKHVNHYLSEIGSIS